MQAYVSKCQYRCLNATKWQKIKLEGYAQETNWFQMHGYEKDGVLVSVLLLWKVTVTMTISILRKENI